MEKNQPSQTSQTSQTSQSRSAGVFDFRRARIKALHGQGLTRAQIAERLGLTKGQVDGVLYKYELKKMVDNGADLKLVAPRNGSRNQPSAPATVNDILPVEVSFEPPPGKVSIFNVRANQCRWLDDGGFFCGEPTRKPTRSYCDHHHALCWVRTKRQVENAALSSVNS